MTMPIAVPLSDEDLADYFTRIAYSGDGKPTLQTLATLHALHPQAIPFENLDPLSGRVVNLAPDAVFAKLARNRRGGHCYEHNGLLKRVLEKLGFTVKGLVARVMWFAPEGTLTPRTHMVLRVDLEGVSYLVDVGFGGLVMSAPLRLDTQDEQATPHERFRLVRTDADICVQAGLGHEWRALYRFDLTEQLAIDYEGPNWFACTHPTSRFVNDLLVARAPAGARYTLLNNHLSLRDAAGKKKQVLHDAGELRRVLEEVFAIAVPQDEATDAALARVVLRGGHI
ncbi:arylamine N-acetyltransferase [Uliginosibacterium sp. H3]|uniref:Arylamine N-acetyltransferase n=1 Tax=Uliginosibacterium silvisoli TaxID=3114758 RepID=A0ABU6JZZ2_9RHOO|nr:arylamine N-acetyltransferase [Uliginosibacterium sp. H3]